VNLDCSFPHGSEKTNTSFEKMMRILISGGPGSGCTSTASAIAERLGVSAFDSDSYFHKPTDPPFQEQYSSDERRILLSSALDAEPSWILSGSVATWGVPLMNPTHGVFLDIPRDVRLGRLERRQRSLFGSRIDDGGDMREEHESFMEWAASYENRTGAGRNSATDQAFLKCNCQQMIFLTEDEPFQEIVSKIINFVTNLKQGC
jgi:adenylate kinase family enzyme